MTSSAISNAVELLSKPSEHYEAFPAFEDAKHDEVERMECQDSMVNARLPDVAKQCGRRKFNLQSSRVIAKYCINTSRGYSMQISRITCDASFGMIQRPGVD